MFIIYFFANKIQQFCSFAVSFRDRRGKEKKSVYFVCLCLVHFVPIYIYFMWFKLIFIHRSSKFRCYSFIIFSRLYCCCCCCWSRWFANKLQTIGSRHANNRTTTIECELTHKNINQLDWNSVHVKCKNPKLLHSIWWTIPMLQCSMVLWRKWHKAQGTNDRTKANLNEKENRK